MGSETVSSFRYNVLIIVTLICDMHGVFNKTHVLVELTSPCRP